MMGTLHSKNARRDKLIKAGFEFLRFSEAEQMLSIKKENEKHRY